MPNVLDRVTAALLRRAASAPAGVPVPPAYQRRKAWGVSLTDSQPWYVNGGGWANFPTSYGTEVDYAAAAGDLDANSAIMACIGWLMRAEPEAPWRVQERAAVGVQALADHALLSLLQRPNPFYSGLALRQATCFSFNLAGNAYWLKERNAAGRVVELWYEPHTTIRARSEGGAFISHYEVWRHGQWQRREAADVIHFRDGIDPRDTRYGLSRLGSALRHVATDQEAARYSYTMLTNLGIVGGILSPADPTVTLEPAEREEIKAAAERNFTGDQRGRWMVTTGAMRYERPSYAPDEMNAEHLHKVPESRLAALLDVPAVVVGLLVGLEHSTYSNMEQAKEHAYEGNLIPYYRTVADTLTHQLVPEFGDPMQVYIDHDLTQVRVLQADQTALYTRIIAAWNAGLLTLNQALQALNWPVLQEGGDVYKTPAGVLAANDGAGLDLGKLLSLPTNGVHHT